MRLWTYLPLEQGECLRCECFGQGTVASFRGSVIGQSAQEVALGILGTIAYAPSSETPRILATGLAGEIKGPASTGTMYVLDVSPTSLGCVVDTEFSPKDELQMSLASEMGSIDARVAIANVRPDPSSPGCFRLGLNIVDMSRLDRARWGRLVLERAEA